MKIRQFRVGFDNFSYLVHCERTRRAALIDPGSNASGALAFIGNENIELVCVINTHYHSDHSAETLRVAGVCGCDIVASEPDAGNMEGVTITVSDRQVMEIGSVRLEFLLTPGHTPGSLCVLANSEALFTGDTLFIGDCGRTDLPGGSNRQMFESLQRLKALPDDTIVYPGHDYGDRPLDTLGNQRRTNKTLKADSLEEFSDIP